MYNIPVMEQIAREIQQVVHDTFDQEVAVRLDRPDAKFGDYATNVALQLAKPLGKNPREIAEQIAGALRETGQFSEVTIAGPGFINLRLTDARLYHVATTQPVTSREGERVVIETNNPNPFKPMHIGHAFNAILADSLANLIEASGAETHRASYHGDVGAHVGRSMYALLNYVQGDAGRLNDISIEDRNAFMGRMYAEGASAYKTDDEARRRIDELATQSFTREDPLYAAIYDTLMRWSFEQIDANVARLGNRPVERRFLESEADARGVATVREHVPDVFQESDGALIFKGSEHGAFDNVFVASNGQGLYAARDLGLMQLKDDVFHAHKSYIVTAEEQRDYFKGVIAAAELALPYLSGVTTNISTGTVKLSTGKMSSRTGDVVTIEWLFDRVSEAITERGGQPVDDVIAGSLRYQFLKVKIGGDVVFDVNESVSLQGNSGPYLQYAHARACSILKKADGNSGGVEITSLTAGERALLVKLGEYAEVVTKATEELLPHHICTYLYELAQEFNRFYEHNKVLGDPRQAERLALVRHYRDTLAKGLGLLGIVAPESM